MSEPIISLQDVTVSYREDVALRGVSLTVNQGEMIGIVGPNGAGKTTILTVINGLARLLGGSATVLGRRLSAGRRGRSFRTSHWATALRREIGYVPQNTGVDPRVPMHVREVVMMGRCGLLGLFRRPGSRDWALVDELVERVGMSHLAHRPFGHLSGGEQQRVAVARALAQEPRVLLLDEPTVSLDWMSQQQILRLIADTHRERGLTTLMVSHDPQSAFASCNRIVLLKDGRLVAAGAPTEILTQTRLASVFGRGVGA